MPQMAPSLWLIIYLFMSLTMILITNNLFFMVKKKENMKEIMKMNKTKKFLWQ
uniref:ATP synthase complex subunit 8 n=1 Tax=Metacrangonyx dominicanus TaxID=1199168 RepID=K7ZWR5_9CRUS|nr:ATP synthase F0 subunit 8 [Metacrangonyx dominicanus]CCI69358.1 ATP synthase F0 subunit 8 [Metacrangonyx dominicanus]